MSETSQNPTDAAASELCRILEEIFLERLDNAERLARELIAREPTNKNAYRVLGQILQRKGNQKGAVDAYSTALSLSREDHAIMHELGLILYRTGELKKAVDLYEKILSGDASNPELLYLLGLAQFHAGQTLKAISSFQKVIEVDPENRIAAYHLAIAFWRAGRLNECAEQLEKIIGAGIEDAAAHYYLGLSYYYLGQLADAAKHFGRSVELDPDDMRSRMFFKLIGERYEFREGGRKRGKFERAALLFRSSLPARITAAVIASFVLILIFFGAYVIHKDGEAYIESVRQEAAAVSEAIERSISDIMNRNEKERIQDVFNEIGRDASFRQVRLLNKKGKVIASTDSSEKGLVFSRESENCKECHAAGGKEKDDFVERIFESGGARSFERITLLYNRESCRKCHGSEHKPLGMLAIAGPLGEGDARLSTRRGEFILFGLLSVV
ncbi:MAG: tetratricopeptide repeat protein, partial [Deltaproteobacteria bacterium]|nr:tetratricopeptide repeat protein [Deltaproteobacteria bacterium]